MIELQRGSSNAAHWTPGQYEARVAGSKSPGAESLVLVAEERTQPAPRIIGFLVAHRVGREWELENIVVAENVRWRGVGFHLATKFVDRAREANGASIFLEVRDSNHPARSLYRKLGFAEVGRRKDYYLNPQEDAVICRIGL